MAQERIAPLQYNSTVLSVGCASSLLLLVPHLIE